MSHEAFKKKGSCNIEDNFRNIYLEVKLLVGGKKFNYCTFLFYIS